MIYIVGAKYDVDLFPIPSRGEMIWIARARGEVLQKPIRILPEPPPLLHYRPSA